MIFFELQYYSFYFLKFLLQILFRLRKKETYGNKRLEPNMEIGSEKHEPS